MDGYVHLEWSGVHGDIECLAVSWPHSHAVVTHCMDDKLQVVVDPHVHGGGSEMWGGQGQLVGYCCRINIQQPTRMKMPYKLKWIVQFLLQECTSRDLKRQL